MTNTPKGQVPSLPKALHMALDLKALDLETIAVEITRLHFENETLHAQVAALTAVQSVAQDGALGLLKFNDDMGASITGLPTMTIKPGDEFLIFHKSQAQPSSEGTDDQWSKSEIYAAIKVNAPPCFEAVINPDVAARALRAYIKDCEAHDIVPDVGGAWHAAFLDGAASRTQPPAGVSRAADELARDLKHAIDTATDLRQQLRLMEESARGEIWRWQADGVDNLATMGNRMGVLIYASDLRNLIASASAKAQAARAGAADTKTHELLSTTVGLLMGYREGGARQPYKPGSMIAKVVDEVVDHLKDWPYPEPTPTAQATPDGAVPDEQMIAEYGIKASRMMARDLTRFDAACEVDKYLREQGAPGYYRHRMSIILFGNVEGTEASRAPENSEPSTTAQAAPSEGDWIDADDVDTLARQLDVALNGEAGAAKQASLCDVVAQVEQASRKLGRPLLAAPAAGAVAGPVKWWNGCDRTVPAALRFLADHERPAGGESSFNSAHLYQLAEEIERMASAPLYAAPTTAAQQGDARLGAIEQAIRDYHYALDTRQHGGVAQDRAIISICTTLDMHWEQGKEANRRATLAQKEGNTHGN